MLIVSFLVVFVTEDAVRLVTKAEKKPPNMRTEQEKIALLGRPRLGDVVRAQIRIKESKEFKVKSNYFIKNTKYGKKGTLTLDSTLNTLKAGDLDKCVLSKAANDYLSIVVLRVL